LRNSRGEEREKKKKKNREMPSRRLPNCRTKQAFGSFATDRKLPMGALLTGGYQITHSFPFAHSSLYDGMSDAGSSLVYEQSESGTAADARRMLANEESFASAFSMSTVAGKGGGGHTSSLSSFHPPPPPPPPLAEEEKRRVVVIRDGGEKEREEGEKKDFWQKRSKQRWEERNKEVVWERHEPHLKEGGGGGGDSGGVAERREYGQSGVGEQGGEEKVKSKSRKPVTFSNAALRVAVPNEEEEEDESEAALAQRWTKAEVEIEIAKLQLLVRGGEKDVTRLKREISQRDRQQRGGVGGSERKGGTLKRGASKVKNSGSVRWSEGKNRDRGPLTKRYARVVEGNEEGEGGEGEEGEGRTTAEEWEEGIKHAGALLRIAKAELKEKHECVVKARHSKGRRILENEYVISGLIPLVGVMCDSVASLVSHKHRSPHTRRPLPPRDGREGEGGGDGDGEREQGVVDRVEAEGEEEGEEKVISKEGEEENEGKGGSGGEKDRNDNHEEKQEEGGKTGGEGEEQRRGEEERSKKKEKGTDRFAAYLDGENNERGKLLSSSGQRDYTMEEKAVIDAEALQYVIRLKTCVSTILEVLACDSESRSLLFGEDVLQNVIDALLEQVEDADMQRALLALLVQLMNHVEIEISSTIDGLFHPLFHSLLSYSEKEDIVELTVEAIWRLSSTRENALSLSTFILQLLPDQLHLISSSPPPRGALMRKSTSTSIFIPTATRTASSPSLPPHLNGGGSNGVGGLPRSPRAGGMRRGTTRGLTLSPGFLPSSPSAPSLASPSLPAGGGGGGSGSGGAKGVKGGVIINLVRVLSRHRLRLRSVRACCYCISNVIMYEATSQELLRAGRRAEIEEEVKRKERERQAETKEGVQISVIGSVEEGGEEKKQTIAAKLGVSDDVEDMKSSLGKYTKKRGKGTTCLHPPTHSQLHIHTRMHLPSYTQPHCGCY